MKNLIILFPLRLMQYLPDYAGKSYGTHRRHYRVMRDAYGKKPHQLLTVQNVADYFDITTEQLYSFLPEHEKTGKPFSNTKQ